MGLGVVGDSASKKAAAVDRLAVDIAKRDRRQEFAGDVGKLEPPVNGIVEDGGDRNKGVDPESLPLSKPLHSQKLNLLNSWQLAVAAPRSFANVWGQKGEDQGPMLAVKSSAHSRRDLHQQPSAVKRRPSRGARMFVNRLENLKAQGDARRVQVSEQQLVNSLVNSRDYAAKAKLKLLDKVAVIY